MNNTSNRPPHEPSRSMRILLSLLRPRFVVPLSILLVLAAAVLIYRQSQITGLPDIGDPFDVEAFGTVEISDEENAAIEYRRAEGLVTKLSYEQMADIEDEAIKEGWHAAQPDVRQWLEDNRTVLEIWYRGTQKPAALFCQPKDMYYGSTVWVVGTRELLWLGALEAARLEAEEDFKNAWKYHRATVRQTIHLKMHGDSLCRFVGDGLFVIASVDGIVRWSNHPQVTAPLLQEAMAQLQQDFQLTPPLSRTVKMEYLFHMNVFRHEEDWPKVFDGLGPYPLSALQLFIRNEPELSRRVTRHAYHNWLSGMDQPLYAMLPVHSGELSLLASPPSPSSPELLPPDEIERFYEKSLLAKQILSYPVWQEAHFRSGMREGILLVIIAAQLHYREHGEFPPQAEDLLGGYLDELPPDTLSNVDEPIRYRRLAADRCRIWSVGANHVDDGGKIDRYWNAPDMDFGFEIGPDGWKGTP